MSARADRPRLETAADAVTRGEETFVITHDLLEGLATQRQDRLATAARQRHTLPATTRRTRERRPLSALAAWVNRA
jgi:hypothetical protein